MVAATRSVRSPTISATASAGQEFRRALADALATSHNKRHFSFELKHVRSVHGKALLSPQPIPQHQRLGHEPLLGHGKLQPLSHVQGVGSTHQQCREQG